MNPTVRTVLFWCHLVAGVIAGVVILVMSVTGVLLAYERQMLAWADTRGIAVSADAGAQRLATADLLARVREDRPDLRPIALTVRADPRAPVAVNVGQRTLQVDPYTGEILGEGAQGLRTFFRSMTEWHRYLAMSGGSRTTGRAITGISNLAFLFIVASGPFLWWPRNASWTQFRQVLLFRRGLGSKARDFNWHNVIGIWSAVPLFVVVLGGVVISYPWAGDLVYAAFGEAPPPRLRPGGPPPGGGPGAGPAGRRGPGARPGNATRPAPGAGPGDEAGRGPGAGPGLGPRAGGRGGQRIDAPLDPAALEGVDRAFEAARRETPSWRTLSVRLPASTEQPLTIAIDTGTGGQPQFRSTLTVNQATGQIEREERYADQSAGRRARSWLRFAHTGEVYGLLGQTVAGAVSLGGAVLVWTGLALALRRFANWRARGRNGRALRAA